MRRKSKSIHHLFPAWLNIVLAVTFSVPVRAQDTLNLPEPGTMISSSPTYTPVLMKGVTLDLNNPFSFDFIVHPGDSGLQGEKLKDQTNRLIKYFLASLTIPEDQMWVNLSPYEKDRIIPEGLGKTEMGRDMLAQDYMLKQITASLINPENKLGSEFWNRVYQRAQDQYGTTKIPINTFNKVWIVPDKAVIYENGTTAVIVESHLKVMLEEDYLALEMNQGSTKHGLGNVTKKDLRAVSGVSSEVIREIIIPELEREVNYGKTFASLRQISNSVILATWYKNKVKGSILEQIYIDKSKTAGVSVEDQEINLKIYNQYVEAFKKGVYHFIKKDYDPITQETILRKYFSGGQNLKWSDKTKTDSTSAASKHAGEEISGAFLARTDVVRIDGEPAMLSEIEERETELKKGVSEIMNLLVPLRKNISEDELGWMIPYFLYRAKISLSKVSVGNEFETYIDKLQKEKNFLNEEIKKYKELSAKSAEASTALATYALEVPDYARERGRIKSQIEKIIDLKLSRNEKKILFYSVGPATGEELLSVLGILFQSLIQKGVEDWKSWDIHVIGLERRLDALQTARLLIYGTRNPDTGMSRKMAQTLEETGAFDRRTKAVPQKILKNDFALKYGDNFDLKKELRSWVKYFSFNLFDEGLTKAIGRNMGQADMVLCRNNFRWNDKLNPNLPWGEWDGVPSGEDKEAFANLQNLVNDEGVVVIEPIEDVNEDVGYKHSNFETVGNPNHGIYKKVSAHIENTKSGKGDEKGGIDFNPNNIEFKMQGSGDKIRFPVSALNYSTRPVDGLAPVIINITPVIIGDQ